MCSHVLFFFFFNSAMEEKYEGLETKGYYVFFLDSLSL